MDTASQITLTGAIAIIGLSMLLLVPAFDEQRAFLRWLVTIVIAAMLGAQLGQIMFVWWYG